jgi:imidazolonepropionase-like amidohydrolase
MLHSLKVYAAFCFTIYCIFAKAQLPKETTFRTNGPDDFREGIHAFVNATIFTTFHSKIDSATLIIQEGKIKAVGKNIALPKGAITHDVAGKFIYPSFIDLFAEYGVQSGKATSPEHENPDLNPNIKGAYGWNDAIKAYYNTANDFKVNDDKAAEWRKIGFGTVLTHRKDGIARGTAAVVSLAADKENFVLLLEKAAAVYSFNKGSSTQEYPSSLMGAIALLRQTYYDAQWYAAVRSNSLNKTEIETNLSLEAWNAQQNLLQIFDAGDWQNCFRAQKIGAEFGKKLVLKTNGTEYQRIDEMKKLNSPIITSLHFPKAYDVEDPYKALYVSLDEMKHWELAPTNAAALQNAGIEFAITPADLEKKEEFLPNLRKAVKHGLKEENALKALTYTPAKLLGIENMCGSLEQGKIANFIITSTSIFNEKCVIHENWIQGKRYEVVPIVQRDIRGNYLLDIYAAKDTLKYSRLQFLGDPSSIKTQIFISDSQKIEVKFSRKDEEIFMAFAPKKNEPENIIRLSGIFDYNNFSISGKGQNAKGEWLSWRARRISPPEADTTKPKKDSVNWSKMGKVWFPQTAYGWEQLPTPKNYLLKNGTVWTSEAEGILLNTDVLIRSGKIATVGKNLSCADCEIIDADNKHITAGIIDEHNHISISGGVNEGTEASSAEVRIGDVINSESIDIYRHLAGGVTAAQLLHGSANPIGGQSALVKMRWGSLPEQMKIEGADGFIKFALGENVKQSNWGDRYRVRYPQTRMGVEQTYYNYFTKAKEYNLPTSSKADKKGTIASNPIKLVRRDLELDALKEILEGKRFITCHSYVQSEINMLMHVADSFGFKVNTFTHILEGYKVADKMKAHGANASTFSDWWAYKMEVVDAIPHNAFLLTRMGINTAINSDDAEMARRLNQEAAKSIKYGGLSEEEAWKMVTINPAKMLHLDKKTGSIKAGKDADVVVWSANPLSIYAVVENTFVDGIMLYSRANNELAKQRNEEERTRLIQKLLAEKKGGAPTQEPIKKEKERYDCGHADQLEWLH